MTEPSRKAFEAWWAIHHEDATNYRDAFDAGCQAARKAFAGEQAAPELLAAWLQWCLDNCDDSPEYNFGTDATEHMRALLAGKPAPMPPAHGVYS